APVEVDRLALSPQEIADLAAPRLRNGDLVVIEAFVERQRPAAKHDARVLDVVEPGVVLAKIMQQFRRALGADALPPLLRYRMKLLCAKSLPAEFGGRLEPVGGGVVRPAAPEHPARDGRCRYLLLRAVLIERVLVVEAGERRVVQIARHA